MGQPLTVVAAVLGQSTTRVTERYAAVVPGMEKSPDNCRASLAPGGEVPSPGSQTNCHSLLSARSRTARPYRRF